MVLIKCRKKPKKKKNEEKNGSLRERHIIGLIKCLIRSSIRLDKYSFAEYREYFFPLIHRINWSCRVTRTSQRRGKQHDTLFKKKPLFQPTEVLHKANTGANKITFFLFYIYTIPTF